MDDQRKIRSLRWELRNLRARSIVAFLMVFGVSLFSYRVAQTPILISDLVLLGWVCCAVMLLHKLELSRVGILAMGWLVFALVSGLVLFLYPYSHLDGEEYFISLVRGMLGTTMLFTVGPVIRWFGVEQIALSIRRTIRLHAFVVVLQGICFGLGLFGINIIRYASMVFSELTWVFTPTRDFGYEYVSGLFAEPAFFGWCICLYMFSLLALYNIVPNGRLQYGDLILVGIAASLSQSFVAVALLGMAIVAHLWRTMEIKKNPRRLAGLTLIIGIMIIFIILGHSIVERNFVDRLPHVLSLTDPSARSRLLGSLEATVVLLSKAPFTGVGLGQMETNIVSIRPELLYLGPGEFSVHFTWAAAMISTGLLGGMLYFLMSVLLALNRSARWVGVGLLVVSFSYGGFLNPALWWFFGFGIAVSHQVAINMRNLYLCLPRGGCKL